MDPSLLVITEAVFGVLLAVLAVQLMVDGPAEQLAPPLMPEEIAPEAQAESAPRKGLFGRIAQKWMPTQRKASDKTPSQESTEDQTD